MAKVIRGNFSSEFIRATHRQGDSPIIMMGKGTFVPGHALTIDADGNVIDAGFPLPGYLPPTGDNLDFSFVVVGDPHLAFSGGLDRWNALTGWIVANQASENIQAVLLKGDYTNTGLLADLQNTWSNGSPAKGLTTIDALGVPWISAIGNHDYNSDSPFGRNSGNFDAQIGYDRINGKSWFEDYYNDGANSKATQAIRFSVGTHKFLIVALEFFPRRAAMQWALNLLDTYPDHYGIVLTHGYLNANGTLIVDGGTYGPDSYTLPSADLSGAEMQPYFLTKANLMQVHCGHMYDSPRQALLESVGDNGNTLRQVYINFQQMTPAQSGLLKIRFSPASGLVYVSDLNVLTGSASLVTPYSFGYDSVAVDSTAPTISGIVATPGGATATITWETNEPSDSQVEYGETVAYGLETTLDAAMVLSHSISLSGLAAGTTYHYRVKSRDAAGNLATSADGIFGNSAPAKSRAVANGVQGRIDFGNSANFVQLGDMSIGFWIKLSADTGGGGVIAGYSYNAETEVTNAPFSLDVQGVSNAWDIRYIHEYGGGSNQANTFNCDLPNGAWRYVGITRDSVAKQVHLYVGVPGSSTSLVATYAYGSNPTGGNSASNMLQLFNQAGSSLGLDGAQMSNFTYHSRALAQAEHDTQMNGSVSAANLLLWAPLGQGTPEPDWSGNGFSGAATNATISEDGPPIGIMEP